MNGTDYSTRLKSILALNGNRSIKRLVREIPIQALIDEDFRERLIYRFGFADFRSRAV